MGLFLLQINRVETQRDNNIDISFLFLLLLLLFLLLLFLLLLFLLLLILLCIV